MNQGARGAKKSVAAVIWIGSGLARRYVVSSSGAIVRPVDPKLSAKTGGVYEGLNQPPATHGRRCESTARQ